jgi:hypothetical protein
VLCFSYLLALWFYLVYQFIQHKKRTLSTHSLSLTRYNWVVIWLTLCLSTALSLHHLVTICLGLAELYVKQTFGFVVTFNILLFPVNNVLLFLTAMSLLFLFWFQANRSRLVAKKGADKEDLSTLFRD